MILVITEQSMNWEIRFSFIALQKALAVTQILWGGTHLVRQNAM